MRRREFVALLGGAAALPATGAAETGLRRVGVVYHNGPFAPSIDGLRDGLRVAGLEEGQHITLRIRDAKGDAAAAEAAARALERDDKVGAGY